VLATKFPACRWEPDAEKKRRFAPLHHERPSRRSLRRLKTDWIDLYQVHRHDPLTPIERRLETLTDLQCEPAGALFRLLEFHPPRRF